MNVDLGLEKGDLKHGLACFDLGMAVSSTLLLCLVL